MVYILVTVAIGASAIYATSIGAIATTEIAPMAHVMVHLAANGAMHFANGAIGTILRHWRFFLNDMATLADNGDIFWSLYSTSRASLIRGFWAEQFWC